MDEKAGSLNGENVSRGTPPCSEGVLWSELCNPLSVVSGDLLLFLMIRRIGSFFGFQNRLQQAENHQR